MINQNTRTLSKALSCYCGESAHRNYKKVSNYQLVTCEFCRQVRLDSVHIDPTNFLTDVTSNIGVEYWGLPDFYKKHEAIFIYFFQERYERISCFMETNGPWLDVGGGYGFWQMFLNNKGHENIGLEIEKKAVEYAQMNGVKVEHRSIEKFQTDQKFAVITMCDVLEHVENPQEILKKCHDLLIPGGVLYIQVPNVLGVKYPYGSSLGLPHHLWQFTSSGLLNLLVREKFKILNHWTGIQGVIRHYEAGGPGVLRKFLWDIARKFKVGNRLQVLVKK